MVTVCSRQERSATARLCQAHAELFAVALLPDASPGACRQALLAGCSSALARDAPPEQVVQAIRAAADGHSLLPTGTAHALAAGGGLTDDLPRLSAPEIAWLQQLARGDYISALAKEAGYSERERFRLLHDLYQRMGAANREEAVAQAARWGLLDAAGGCGPTRS